MGLELGSHDPSTFDPDVLPIVPPSLAELDPYGFDETSAYGYGTYVFLGISNGTQNVVIRASISLLEAMPEPAAATLLGVGLAGIVALRRRRSS